MLNSWKAATLTYHLMTKFPTEYGVGELRGDQVAAHECYIAMLEMEDHQQTMCIGEQRTMAEPVEELEEISLDESRPERITRMGTLASPLIRQDLAAFLRISQDVFAWGHEDMYLSPPSSYSNKASQNRVLSSSLDPVTSSMFHLPSLTSSNASQQHQTIT